MKITNEKKRKQVVSFALDPTIKMELEKLEHHTLFVATAVSLALGRCPCCHGPWPEKEKQNEKKENG
jgi:hypothetical protein